jgi:hypothetical protein
VKNEVLFNVIIFFTVTYTQELDAEAFVAGIRFEQGTIFAS